jgi:hypothetical protein
MHLFESLAYAIVLDEERSKLNTKGIKCVLDIAKV